MAAIYGDAVEMVKSRDSGIGDGDSMVVMVVHDDCDGDVVISVTMVMVVA